MIDLHSISSLPIQYDPQKEVFVLNQGVICKKHQQVNLEGLIPALLNRTLRYPEVVYKEDEEIFLCDDSDIFAANPVKYELIVLPPGLLGIEFIKSHIYYSDPSDGKHSCVVECQYGILTILIQKNKEKDEFDFDTSIKEGILIKLRKGEKVAIPTGYYYTFINTKDTAVIFSRIFKAKGIVNYDKLGREKGLGYFAIRKNARAEVVFNPRYKNVPRLSKKLPSCEEYKTEYNDMPLYQAVKKHIDYFIDILQN